VALQSCVVKRYSRSMQHPTHRANATRMNRRRLLAWGGALLAVGTSSAAEAPQRTSGPAAAAALPAPPAIPVPAHWSAAPRIALWPGSPPGAATFDATPPPADWPASYRRSVAMPELHVFRPERPNGRAILAIPGGAYWFVSIVNEGADLAPRLNERGYTVFVLTYRLPGEGWAARADVPLQDAQRAMRVIRSRAREFGLDARQVSVIGFSAGGHLAATLATRHADVTYAPVDAVDALDARPQAAALVYPVVTLRDPLTHALSRRLLLGDAPSPVDVDRRSAERHVDAATPPLFLVHAIDDTAVPAENSLQMMQAMRSAARPVELHLLQEGGHAFGVGRPGTPSAQWIDLLCAWLDRLPRQD
jgi:acetyl esterase/lipase